MSKLIKLSGQATAGEVPEADGAGNVTWEIVNVPIVNTAAKTSAQIDALFTPTPGNGSVIADATNGLLLVRLAGKWSKTAALTQIA